MRLQLMNQEWESLDKAKVNNSNINKKGLFKYCVLLSEDETCSYIPLGILTIIHYQKVFLKIHFNLSLCICCLFIVQELVVLCMQEY